MEKHMKKRTALFGTYWLLDAAEWSEGGQMEGDLWHAQQWAEERGLKVMVVAFEIHGRQKFHIVTIPVDQEEPSHAQVTRLYESLPEVEDREIESLEAMQAGDESGDY